MPERKGAQTDLGAGGAAQREEPGDDPEARRGPRGGRTTITRSGMVKKNLWVPHEVAEALRRKAFEERRSEAEIIREALEHLLDEGREEGA
jgi:hypothetical protein